MRKIISIFTATALLLLSSCEKEFSPDFANKDTMIQLLSFPSSLDTTVFKIQAATSVLKDTAYHDMSKAQVKVTVAGKECEVKYNLHETENLPERSFYMVRHIEPGEEIKVSVSHPTAASVSSSTVMPSRLTPGHISPTVEPDSNSVLFRIPVEGLESEDFIGVTIVRDCEYIQRYHPGYYDEELDEWCYDYDTVVTDTTYSSDGLFPKSVSDESLFSELEPGFVTLGFNGRSFDNGWWGDGTYPLTIMRLKDRDGSSAIEFRTDYTYEGESFYYSKEGVLMSYSKQSCWYKVMVYHMSPESYRYAKSMYDRSHNSLAYVGLAPATFTYTNVAGGLGTVGAIILSESDIFSL